MHRVLIPLFESKLSFRISASVTILMVVSVCSAINRFPFDCFFSFQTVFVSCRDSRRFFCVGQFSGVQTRPIVVAHAPSPFSIFVVIGVTRLGTHPFSSHLSHSLFALPRYPFPFTLRAGFKYAKRLFFLAASASSLVWSAAPT